jgi:hypothetical protein
MILDLIQPSELYLKMEVANIDAFRARGVHSLFYFAYTCVRDLFVGGVIYLAEKIIR